MDAEIQMLETQMNMLARQKEFNTANVNLMNSRVDAQIAETNLRLQALIAVSQAEE
jgi:hypothetical protein